MTSSTEFAPDDIETVEDALALLNAALDTPIAMASHIEDEEYTLIGIDDHLDTGLDVGAEFETSETFCHCVYEGPKRAEMIPDIGADERVAGLPAHENLGLEAYIGVPLYRDDEFYGTLVVSDTAPREFTDEEIQHAKTVAKLIQSVL
ncbi:GAF domain-containing protein [Haloarcula sp. Atlit-120R]|uniref:GAF domain-containing protein n=1 Tax=Haloarcula sp. Atlit-120R TaxID=2282135 RepID=UPI0013144B84|nr:GAF domain-containing protein [Haloarcula sp. Atlit-120R]